ncbi:hypothetical protein [uncultured Roseobacter sp.]|uniref:hypothetical protein n=1 Tax=uncultured Roseobacter sp. TaxID=114847 RepID=UPI00263A30A3|nr:hypothetical protein [uncultured Roseobacter sp.]
MATPEEMAEALDLAGLNPVLIDAAPDPYHIAVPFPGLSVEDEPVLRINLLDSADGDLELWQMIVVIPAQAVTDRAWSLVRNMLNTVNMSLTTGKVLAMEDEQMLYYTCNHLAPPGDSALKSGPAVVRFVLENLGVLSPALVDALSTDPPPDFEAAERALQETHDALEELAETISTER